MNEEVGLMMFLSGAHEQRRERILDTTPLRGASVGPDQKAIGAARQSVCLQVDQGTDFLEKNADFRTKGATERDSDAE